MFDPLCQVAIQGCTQGVVAWMYLGQGVGGEETAVMRADLAPVRSEASLAWVLKSLRTVSLVWTPLSCQTASLSFYWETLVSGRLCSSRTLWLFFPLPLLIEWRDLQGFYFSRADLKFQLAYARYLLRIGGYLVSCEYDTFCDGYSHITTHLFFLFFSLFPSSLFLFFLSVLIRGR